MILKNKKLKRRIFNYSLFFLCYNRSGDKMKNRGFTLVELLTSIILIGIIIGLAVPAYGKYINKSRKNSFKETLIGLSRAIELHIASDSSIDYSDPIPLDAIELEAENISSITDGSFYVKKGKVIFVDVSNAKTKFRFIQTTENELCYKNLGA